MAAGFAALDSSAAAAAAARDLNTVPRGTEIAARRRTPPQTPRGECSADFDSQLLHRLLARSPRLVIAQLDGRPRRWTAVCLCL